MTGRFAAAVSEPVGDHRLVVALGGGADSAMLLRAAVDALGAGRTRAVFVDHGLDHAELLRTAAIDIAAACGAPITIGDAPVADGPNLEARARAARYETIEALLTEGELAATAHTRDDQAETVLMHLLRGSGATGLSGIPPVRGRWRRPFLGFSRSELRSAATDLGLPFVDDPANTDSRFLRSKIRHELFPLLEGAYGQGVRGNLVRAAGLLAADDEQLERAAARVPVQVVLGVVAIPVAPLVTAPGPIAGRVVRRAIRSAGNGYPGSKEDVAAVLTVAADGGAAHIGEGIMVRRVGPFVELGERRAPAVRGTVGLGGAGSFRWGSDEYVVRVATAPVPVRTAGRFTVVAGPPDELIARPVSEGDRIEATSGTTPVRELLRVAGVAPDDRSCWLVVANGAKIAAVAGVSTAPWATPETGGVVTIIERSVRR